MERYGGKYNRVHATGITGIFKDKQIEILIGDSGGDTVIKVNGKKIDNCVGAWIKILPDRPTKLTLDLFPVNKH